MKTMKCTFECTEYLKNIIENCGVIAFPTETVYGLGIRSDSFLAYSNIFKAKNRDQSKSLTLMLSDIDEIENYAYVDSKIKKVIDKFMPGPITIILDKKQDTNLYGGMDTIGIRIPDSQDTLALLKGIGIPMYVTSANISNQEVPIDGEGVLKQLDNRIDAIVMGKALNNEASTIVSLINGEIKILREGQITLDQIKEVYES